MTSFNIAAACVTELNRYDYCAEVEIRQTEGEGKMKRRIIQPWTPSDDERLRKLAAEGRSSVTIAERMKRTPPSIWARARRLKIVLRRANALEAAKTFARGERDKER